MSTGIALTREGLEAASKKKADVEAIIMRALEIGALAIPKVAINI